MSDDCFPVEDLDEVIGSPRGDPRRRHANDCARCRSLIVSYERFTSGAGLPPDFDASEMDTRLAEALDREIFGPSPPPPSPLRVLLEALRGRLTVRVAAAVLASAVVVIVGVREASRLMPEDRDRIVLRQAPPETGMAAEVEATEEGLWRFTWSPVEEADGYAVVLLGADLVERARVETSGLSLVVDTGELPPPLDTEVAVLWRVVALRDQDEIAHSPTRLLPSR